MTLYDITDRYLEHIQAEIGADKVDSVAKQAYTWLEDEMGMVDVDNWCGVELIAIALVLGWSYGD